MRKNERKGLAVVAQGQQRPLSEVATVNLSVAGEKG